MSQDKIRQEILEIVYSRRPRTTYDAGKVSRQTLYDALEFDETQIDKACSYLFAKNYVVLWETVFDDKWTHISITDEGISYYESLDRGHDDTASNVAHNVGHQTMNIYGDVHGDAIQAIQSDVSKITYLSEGFERARSLLWDNKDYLSQNRDIALKHIDFIEEEYKKVTPSKAKIDTSWTWIKKNAPKSVISIIEKIVAGLILQAI